MALTGRFNLRRTLFGRIILQVEEEVKSTWSLFSGQPKFRRRWRDATAMDLAASQLRALMDLRDRPRFTMQAFEPTQIVRPVTHQSEPVPPTLNGSTLREEEPRVRAH